MSDCQILMTDLGDHQQQQQHQQHQQPRPTVPEHG